MRTRVAIVIPSYNSAFTVSETLQSVQSCFRAATVGKVVLVDDNSSDNSVTIAQREWSAEVPLEVVLMERNSGERAVVNFAARKLSSEGFCWFLLLHADDLAKPSWVSCHLEAIEVAPDSIGTISSMWDTQHADGSFDTMMDADRQLQIRRAGEETFENLLRIGCWWKVSGCAIRIEALIDVNGFDERMPQLGDWDFVLRLVSSGWDLGFIYKSLTIYREHEGSVTSVSFQSNRDLRERIILTSRHLVQAPTLWNWWHYTMIAACFRRLGVAICRGQFFRAINVIPLMAQFVSSWSMGALQLEAKVRSGLNI